MHIVHVKHYLDLNGVHFFHNEWFPKVKSILTQQKGFVSINYDSKKSTDESVYIIVTFEDQTTLDKWVAHPEHDNLIHALDKHRNMKYWEYAIFDEKIYQLEWKKVCIQ